VDDYKKEKYTREEEFGKTCEPTAHRTHSPLQPCTRLTVGAALRVALQVGARRARTAPVRVRARLLPRHRGAQLLLIEVGT
jgi:hypothetical protein